MASNQVKRNPLWFYLILILIPVIFFIIFELALRFFNYGDDYTQWVKVTENKYMLNPDYTRKFFFTTANVPASNGNVFDVDKASNSFRVFILGGSSAAGFPFTPNGDFGRYLQKRLEFLYPSKRIEIVNAAITAVNSYTLRDLVPGILEQKPDLIIIYAGHNEFYGALGAGSMESVGNSRSIVNLVIYLNNFKTTQFVRNTMKWVSGLFSSGDKNSKGGTLMARMAKEQLIPLNSDIYNAGISQFEGNMKDILEMTKKAGVPVIMSTLTSNLKDQPPFVSEKNGNNPAANEVYNNALEGLEQGRYAEAESLFVYAKDLDALRFRASSDINRIIKNLADEYGYPVADIYSAFNYVSPFHITGNNLMTDHLHPTLEGYHLLGREIFKVMEKERILPDGIQENSGNSDSAAIKNFYFTPLDSTIARYRITILKNDWPFSESKEAAYILKQFNIQNAIDSIALRVINEQVIWEEARRMAAKVYLKLNDFYYFSREMLVLMDQFPYIDGYFISTAETLLEAQQYDLALEILHKKFHYSPDAFSSKWIGIIELSKYNDQSAVRYLTESLKYKSNDSQVLFNLAGAYSMSFQYKKALETINKCIDNDPQFPGARELKMQLETAVKRVNR